MTTDTAPGGAERLGQYVEVWQRAIDDFLLLLEDTPESVWATPTDLPGWDVHALVAHTAHLEQLLAGGRHEQVDVGDPPHVRSPVGTFTEQGVVARRDRSAAELIDEIRTATQARADTVAADPPTDPQALAHGLFGAMGWDVQTLLRNRPLDIWMHEQDLRRAIGRPGGLDTPPAAHTIDYLLDALGYVVGKRVGAPEGSTVRMHVVGHKPIAVTVREGRAGRTRGVPSPEQATVSIDIDRDAFIVLAGGRRTPVAGSVRITGDVQLGREVVDNLGVTP